MSTGDTSTDEEREQMSKTLLEREENHPQTIVDERDGRSIVIMDSARWVDPRNTEKDVVVPASYIGVLPARMVAIHRPRGVIGHDACVGKDGAGIAGLWYLEALGIPAATADGMSAEMGNGADLYEHGVISHLNYPAERCGVQVGMSVREAAALLRDVEPTDVEVSNKIRREIVEQHPNRAPLAADPARQEFIDLVTLHDSERGCLRCDQRAQGGSPLGCDRRIDHPIVHRDRNLLVLDHETVFAGCVFLEPGAYPGQVALRVFGAFRKMADSVGADDLQPVRPGKQDAAVDPEHLLHLRNLATADNRDLDPRRIVSQRAQHVRGPIHRARICGMGNYFGNGAVEVKAEQQRASREHCGKEATRYRRRTFSRRRAGQRDAQSPGFQ